ncbi:hypothetical protein [Candidatus Methylacidiphilum infernorum]|uniref:Uncharacterized protein n=1 Tax=Methylacidiphilum infernorum (isolate V4) TaxID=481448 RepID=B3DX57_METI4|nr:hypothetical protein [Candidatus Methylacidiphilum infernorum]ACD82197.1 Hypothetical protein Minf_0137 [Methylacidiphilum infernorum V4]
MVCRERKKKRKTDERALPRPKRRDALENAIASAAIERLGIDQLSREKLECADRSLSGVPGEREKKELRHGSTPSVTEFRRG